MDQRLQPKQFIGEIRNSRGLRFRVYQSGDPKWLLLKPLDDLGCESVVDVPVERSNLRLRLPRA